ASDGHSPYCDIGAKHRMHLPHGRIPERDSLNEHILAAIGLDKLRTQVMTLAEYSLLHWNALFSHFKQQLSILALIGTTFFPAALIPAFPRPPVLTIGIAINRAAAGDSNVLLLKGIDKGRVVHQLDPFPTGKNQGIFP